MREVMDGPHINDKAEGSVWFKHEELRHVLPKDPTSGELPGQGPRPRPDL
jgi:hypothetical protein